MRILGIVCDTHDSGIALLQDGVPAVVPAVDGQTYDEMPERLAVSA